MKYFKQYENYDGSINDEFLLNIYKNGLRNRNEETKQVAIDKGFELHTLNKKILIDWCKEEIADFHIIKEIDEKEYRYLVEYTTTLNFLDFKKLNSLEGLTCLVNLEELSLDGNKFTDLTPLLNLKKLYSLSLNQNNLKTENVSILKELPDLTELYLVGNEIDNLSVFRDFKTLGTLDISDNKITSLEPTLFFEGVLETFYYLGNLLPSGLDRCSPDMGEDHPDGECVANFYGYSYNGMRNLPYPNEENRKR